MYDISTDTRLSRIDTLILRTNENSDVGVPVYGIDGISSTAASVSLSSDHTCVLMGDASIRCFGMDDAGQLGEA